MPYPAILSRRIPYDINGTKIGKSTSQSYSSAISEWLSQSDLTILNDDINGNYYHRSEDAYNKLSCAFYWFFPERIEFEYMSVGIGGSNPASLSSLQGSNDTTNGMDGTWETAIFPNGTPNVMVSSDSWRLGILPVSFSSPYKFLRCFITVSSGSMGNSQLDYIHIYGRKAYGETLDDILFCDENGNELTALTDWGDRPEGTTVIKSFKVKNASTTKIANNVNLQLNHADFLMSLDQITWVATIDIASIPANSLSAEIFIKNALGPPLLTLGPKAARIIATVGSFT